MILSRLSYNTNGWQIPSGPVGKSINHNVHEFEYGFGFEEWLFNDNFYLPDKNDIKWHYGYIEGIHKNYRTGDELLPLKLFTINCFTHQRFWVAEVSDWKKADQNESAGLIVRNAGLINAMSANLMPLINNVIALQKFNIHVNNQYNHQLFNIIYSLLNIYN